VGERLVPLPFVLSTADAEGRAELRFSEDTLELRLRDWQSHDRHATFTGVRGFRWTQELRGIDDAYRDDGVFEVLDSVWVAELRRAGHVRPDDVVKHVLIGFNEESAWLEVVCESFA
jgi:hypothetical protein